MTAYDLDGMALWFAPCCQQTGVLVVAFLPNRRIRLACGHVMPESQTTVSLVRRKWLQDRYIQTGDELEAMMDGALSMNERQAECHDAYNEACARLREFDRMFGGEHA